MLKNEGLKKKKKLRLHPIRMVVFLVDNFLFQIMEECCTPVISKERDQVLLVLD